MELIKNISSNSFVSIKAKRENPLKSFLKVEG